MKRLVFCMFILGLLSGCATMSDVMQSKDQGTSQVYPVTFDQAGTISMTVLRWEGADAIEEHKDQRYMLTSSGMNLVTFGSVMGVWVDPMPDGQMKVTVVTKRRIQTNVATTAETGLSLDTPVQLGNSPTAPGGVIPLARAVGLQSPSANLLFLNKLLI